MTATSSGRTDAAPGTGPGAAVSRGGGREELRRRFAFHAAALFFISALTGAYVAAAMQKMIPADRGHALASHLNALLASFWLVGIAWSLRYSTLSAKGEAALFWLALSSSYGNWLITAIKALLHVHGVGPEGNLANDAIFGLLTVFVVLPTFGAGALWVAALRGRASPPGA